MTIISFTQSCNNVIISLTAHGGLIIYIHNDFEFKELNEELPITHTSNSFESLFVKVWRKNYTNQKYVIGII